MLHLWGCNWAFYAKLAVLLLERSFCRFLFHVKQKSIICAFCGRNGLNRWNRKLCATIGTRDGRRYLKAGCKKICVLCASALTAFSISARSLCFCALNRRWKAREFILKRKKLLLWLRIGRFSRLFHVKQSWKLLFNPFWISLFFSRAGIEDLMLSDRLSLIKGAKSAKKPYRISIGKF